jgi:hypothetical protein
MTLACNHVRFFTNKNSKVASGKTVFQRLIAKGAQSGIADAHRDGKRFIVHADDFLNASLERERTVCTHLLRPD